jgi:hypothetical protein
LLPRIRQTTNGDRAAATSCRKFTTPNDLRATAKPSGLELVTKVKVMARAARSGKKYKNEKCPLGLLLTTGN